LKTRKVSTVSCGDFHTIVLDQEGLVWTWIGGNEAHNHGQCGLGNLSSTDGPMEVEFFRGKDVKFISAGGYHSLAACLDQSIYGWGAGSYGENGNLDF
jgi:hypothetical protein